jgi:hypothetical protein
MNMPPNMRLILTPIALVSSVLAFQPADPQPILNRTLDIVGFPKLGGKVLHWRDMQGIEQNYQSPPPFITVLNSRESWVDPGSGVERSSTLRVFPGSWPQNPVTTVLGPLSPGQQRNLDVFAVLSDWRDAHDVRMAPGEVYNDYPRTVLSRVGEYGEERLFIDAKTGFPVKLDREEPHYLWGQVHAEYVYSNWIERDGTRVPAVSARVVDGFKEITRTIGDFDFIDRGKAPDLTAPPAPTSSLPLFLQPLPPKKVEVSEKVFLSVNTGYTEAIALIGDTIYVLDATQGGKRAQQDLDLIRETFPGKHKIVVMVTDLAWPHIAGIRFWVASGATVVSHRASKEFLTRVIERRWTRAPDLLEQRRKAVKFNFVAVDKSYVTAGGKLQLIAIDGIESEGALLAWLPDEGFLWASDYIQNLSRPATYTSEVWQAVRRAGFVPQRVAAMHIPLTSWKAIESLAKPPK